MNDLDKAGWHLSRTFSKDQHWPGYGHRSTQVFVYLHSIREGRRVDGAYETICLYVPGCVIQPHEKQSKWEASIVRKNTRTMEKAGFIMDPNVKEVIDLCP